MIAPRRAIGVPSAASRVTLGGVGGCSDLDSGAVSARYPIATTSRTIAAATPRISQRQMLVRRRGGGSIGSGIGGGTGGRPPGVA